jgi:hypothetical protein
LSSNTLRIEKMKKLSITLYFLLLACATSVAFAGGKPNSCGSDNSNLEIVFNDSVSNKIRSDGLGSYKTTKGKSGADVRFQLGNCSFDLVVSLSSARKMVVDWASPYGTMASRAFIFDRVASVPQTNWNNEEFRNFCGYTLDTPNVVRNSNGTYLYDNYAGCGKDPDSYDEQGNFVEGKYFVRRAASFTVEGYVMRFQDPMNDASVLGNNTAYVKIYRVDAKNYALSPENAPLRTNQSYWAALIYGDNNTAPYIKDHQSMAFNFTVRNLQP